MGKQISYKVPDGYFQDLERKLLEIPDAGGRKWWDRPAVWGLSAAIAAAVAALIVAGTAIFAPSKDQNQVAYAFNDTELTDGEIIEYLIDSGMTSADLEDYYPY